MSRILLALILVTLVASCGARGDRSIPRNLDNACALARERPDIIKAFKSTERKWGVPMHVMLATVYQESKFKADARPPIRYTLGVIPMGRASSAYGYAQALDGTWDEYKREQGKRFARRDRIKDAADFIGWYQTLSKERNGIPLTNATHQYLAYHEGHTGYRRGSYKSKAWLLRVSREVGQRSTMYQRQLQGCRHV